MRISLPHTDVARRIVATVHQQEVLPVVNGNFESNVRGVYVIGDVTGLPLVKVAAMHGAQLLDKMEKSGALRRIQGEDGRLDMVIIGAGPADCLPRRKPTIAVCATWCWSGRKWRARCGAFPPGRRSTPSPAHWKTGASSTWKATRRNPRFWRWWRVWFGKGLKVKEGVEVKRVVKQGEGEFEVVTEDGRVFPTRSVVVAIGRQGQPRLLEVPGAGAWPARVASGCTRGTTTRTRTSLWWVGGNSAIEAALMLKDTNRVTLAYRGDTFYRAKEANRLSGGRGLGRPLPVAPESGDGHSGRGSGAGGGGDGPCVAQ